MTGMLNSSEVTSYINNLRKIVLEPCNICYIVCDNQEFSACRTMWTHYYYTGIYKDEDKDITTIVVEWKITCSIPKPTLLPLYRIAGKYGRYARQHNV